MLPPIAPAIRFVRENSWSSIWREILRRDGHPFLQFIKYGICGVAAAVAHNGIMALLSLTVFPAGKGMIVDGQVLDEAVRNRHLLLNNSIAWPFGTLVAYFMNIAFVFTPGRHSKLVELGLFTLVSAIGFFPGIFVVNWLAGHLHLPSTVAQLGFIITSVMVNFLCRKFIIFRG
jgi:putative flippase GtrA